MDFMQRRSCWVNGGGGFSKNCSLQAITPNLYFSELFCCLNIVWGQKIPTKSTERESSSIIIMPGQEKRLQPPYHHHHHHVVPPARISLTLPRHFSLSFIAPGMSSGLHPVSSHSCCMYIRAGRPAFAWPYAGFHRSTSLMSSSLLLQQCPACLVLLTSIVFVTGGSGASRTCSILFATFLCNCRLASSSAV